MDSLVAVVGTAVAVAAVVTVVAARLAVRGRRELARLRQQLAVEQQAANSDHLTGLPNRRRFYRDGAALVREAVRRPLVAVLVDLDDFKRINDTFGHRAGDEVLATVARRLAGVADGGLVARLGGDEFAALLDRPLGRGQRLGAHADRLAETGGRIAEVLSVPVPVAGGWKVAVRASIGVVAVTAGSDLDEVLERADAAMYQAKTARTSPEAAPLDAGPGNWFAADAQRRQVRAVAGDAFTWSSG
jgi:diguanylate cyclase (GGDEF)-like protein